MDISVIIPFYYGNSFKDRIETNINTLASQAKNLGIKIEFLIVNDSPEEEIDISTDYAINYIENKNNSGIHQTRINGLMKSEGEYIIFLDQDDKIFSKKILNNYDKIKKQKSDVIVSNGIFELENSKYNLIYPNNFYLNKIVKEYYYLHVKDLIVSPGQCIIKKSSIPVEWINNTLDINGTDDYLLWLLMFNENRKFIFSNKIAYCHHDTGINVSSDIENWKKSLQAMEVFLDKHTSYPYYKLKKIKKLNQYKYSFAKKKNKDMCNASIRNINLFFINLFFRLIYGNISKKRYNNSLLDE